MDCNSGYALAGSDNNPLVIDHIVSETIDVVKTDFKFNEAPNNPVQSKAQVAPIVKEEVKKVEPVSAPKP